MQNKYFLVAQINILSFPPFDKLRTGCPAGRRESSQEIKAITQQRQTHFSEMLDSRFRGNDRFSKSFFTLAESSC